MPEAVTLMRWRSILNDATENDRVASLYCIHTISLTGPARYSCSTGCSKLLRGLENPRGS